MSIGKRIKQRRIGQHLTQAQLADLIGTIKQTIYKYEHDIITNIPIERLKAIAKALNTSISYLVGATDEPDENSFASLALELAFFETARKEIDEETRVAIKAFLSEIKEAEKRLLKAAHEICHRTPESGIDDQSGPYNAGRIDVITDFILGNEKYLRVLLAAADESQWSETETHELLNPEAQVLPDTSKLKEKQTNSETKGTSDE